MERAAEERGVRAGRWLKSHDTEHQGLARAVEAAALSLRLAASQLEVGCRIATLLDVIFAHHVAPTASPPSRVSHRSVRRMVDLLQAEYTRDVSLAELAAAAGLNRFHAIRAFKQYLGVPPHTYQIGLRVAKAQHLLSRGIDGSQAALASGFCDQSHLIRCFRRGWSVPPTAFYGHARAPSGCRARSNPVQAS
jgi:AraC-like DNA-binding protein